MGEYAIWVAIASGALGGFFAACHQALHTFSMTRLDELLRSRGHENRSKELKHSEDLILLTAMFRSGFNIVVMLASVLWFVEHKDGGVLQNLVGVIEALLLASCVIGILGVAVPLSWGRYAAETLLASTLPILGIFRKIMTPLLALTHGLDVMVKRMLGVREPDEDDPTPAEQEILDAVSEGEKTGQVDESQADMIEAVVEFSTTSVDKIMSPRTDIEGIEADSTLENVKQIIKEKGHSRYPVYDENLDSILGILYAKDLLQFIGMNGNHEFNLRDVLHNAVFVPESKTLRDLLGEFQAMKVHMAVVLDEYGGTAGLVTIEDILEEIVGEIEDEYETGANTEPIITIVENNVAEADGRVHIDDLNDVLNIDLPEDEDYDTIGGFVFSTLGHIPESGESFKYENVRLTVTEAEKTKVNRVKVEILAKKKAELGNTRE